MGRERGNTFNQGADGELIECVEKSGFCDNILFPHSASAPPGFSIRTPGASSCPALSKDVFPGNLRRAPGDTKLGMGGGWGEGWTTALGAYSLPLLSHQSLRRLGSKKLTVWTLSSGKGIGRATSQGFLQRGSGACSLATPFTDPPPLVSQIQHGPKGGYMEWLSLRVALSPRNIWQCLKTFSGCHD